MGSMITLGIGKMELDWGKNNVFSDHSALFQASDVKAIPYYYVDSDTDGPIIELKEGYARKLSQLKRRLDLLGYDMKSLEKHYDELISEDIKHGYKSHLSFEQFCEVVKSINIPRVDTVGVAIDTHENGYDFGEYVRKCIFEDPAIEPLFEKVFNEREIDEYCNPKWDLAYFLENLNPYITLRILAENPSNSECELQWRFSDVVEGGWVNRNEVVKGLSLNEKILIVTEGSSDSYVLRKALDALYPDIADFFYFVDMEENYPFTGVGHLYNFCVGLLRISIQNNVIAIFDNDTAGIEKFEQAADLDRLPNFLITKLPNHPSFTIFTTRGPQGETTEDINGKAVAIECFLDLQSVNCEPFIQWTAYNKKARQYQGELSNKDEYIRKFKNSNLTKSGDYNTGKLRYLVDYLLKQWIENR